MANIRHPRSTLLWLILAAILVPPPLHAQDVIIEAMARATKKPLMHLSAVEINLERTGCFGTCPAYGVQLCGHDLSVRYFGEAAVNQQSLRQTVSGDEFYAVLEQFFRVRFFELPAEYELTPYILHAHADAFVVMESYTTDLPNTYLELRVGNRTKRITLRINEPAELRELAARIDTLVGTAALVSGETPPNSALPLTPTAPPLPEVR